MSLVGGLCATAFPRSVDRGPIEACRPPPAAKTGPDFRDQSIAAPLKQLKWRVLHHPRQHFRDQSIAAPLKPAAVPSKPRPEAHFRDQSIAAPLKQAKHPQATHGLFISAISRSRPH